MIKRIASSIAGVCLVCLSAAPALAQYPNTREGFWIGFGVGSGSVGTSCFDCDGSTTSGTSGYLSMGGTVNRSFLIGGEATIWAHPESGVNEQVGFISLVGIWYPQPRGAFFVKFGLGEMSYTLDDGTNKITANAPAGSIGVGYDFRVGRKFSLTPYINSFATSRVSFQVNDAPVAAGERITLNLLQFGLGFHWH